MKELTLRVVILGVVLSVVMGAANVYLGLKAGMTVSASIPAAVIAMLVLRTLFGDGTILEANQVQTAASAGESLAAGIIFTMPALLLIGFWTEFDMLMTTAISFTGGMLGILFMIPMRRVFVTGDQSEELKFPEGVACAAVLRAGQDDEGADNGASSVVIGALFGAAFKFLASFVHLFTHTLEGAYSVAGRLNYMGADISPALVAVGFIVRLNVALLIFLGGAIGWLVGMPLLAAAGDGPLLDQAWGVWSTQIRYIGVGAMVVGGLASIYRVRGGLVSAITVLRKGTGSVASDLRDRDLPGPVIAALSLLVSLLIGWIYYGLTGDVVIAAVTTVIMVVMSFFFTAVASYIVGLVGNSNSPVSGMTITAVLFTGALLLLFGFTGMQGMVATLGVAAIVCCAACTSGDVCNDLKTGQIVGASPYRQQIMQIIGVAVASLVMAPVLQLLHENTPGGIGGKELAAPQAGLFAALAKGFFGDTSLPWNLVAIGAVIGVILLVGDALLERKGSEFRLHLMPIAVGMYLPFGLALPILVGGLIAHGVRRKEPQADEDSLMQRGVLFCSGVIAGESLMGVGLALLATGGIKALHPGLSSSLTFGLTAAAALGMVWLFKRRCQNP
jgi:putative OPT family oligopeptide transporter